jgi:hypothetical protein
MVGDFHLHPLDLPSHSGDVGTNLAAAVRSRIGPDRSLQLGDRHRGVGFQEKEREHLVLHRRIQDHKPLARAHPHRTTQAEVRRFVLAHNFIVGAHNPAGKPIIHSDQFEWIRSGVRV